jgi:hypothetical protein
MAVRSRRHILMLNIFWLTRSVSAGCHWQGTEIYLNDHIDIIIKSRGGCCFPKIEPVASRNTLAHLHPTSGTYGITCLLLGIRENLSSNYLENSFSTITKSRTSSNDRPHPLNFGTEWLRHYSAITTGVKVTTLTSHRVTTSLYCENSQTHANSNFGWALIMKT